MAFDELLLGRRLSSLCIKRLVFLVRERTGLNGTGRQVAVPVVPAMQRRTAADIDPVWAKLIEASSASEPHGYQMCSIWVLMWPIYIASGPWRPIACIFVLGLSAHSVIFPPPAKVPSLRSCPCAVRRHSRSRGLGLAELSLGEGLQLKPQPKLKRATPMYTCRRLHSPSQTLRSEHETARPESSNRLCRWTSHRRHTIARV